MLKKVFWVVMVIVFMTGIIGLGGCESEERLSENAKKYILRHTGIVIPIDTIFVYDSPDDTFVNGRHPSFTVFAFENEPTAWLEEHKFLRSDDETLVDDEGDSLVYKNERYFRQYLGDKASVNGVKIPDEYIPNFKIPYLWIRPRNVYFFYYPETLRLTVYVAWS